ncbi:hypothetical protein E2R56_26215 [Rhodococcus qingshengii]|nr:hypothetical protein E2R56_26215 [Rhodococcus qingshengii]
MEVKNSTRNRFQTLEQNEHTGLEIIKGTGKPKEYQSFWFIPCLIALVTCELYQIISQVLYYHKLL